MDRLSNSLRKRVFVLSSIANTVNLDNLIFANSIKRHICHIKNSQLGHDLPTSVNDSAFSILRGFYFQESLHLQCFTKNLITLTIDALTAFCFLS